MSTIGDALRAGNVEQALAAATAAVKAAPTDADARWLMAEVLVVAGDLERADKMLDAAALHEPNPAVLEFRGLLRAEVIRRQVIREGRAPKYQGNVATDAQQAAMRARITLRASDIPAAALAAAQVETLRPRVPGQVEVGAAAATVFDDLRDADDLMAAEFDVLTVAGDHMLVAVERIRSLVFDAPRRTRDLIWRRCTIDLKDGTEGVVFFPALYLGLQPETDNRLRLGRNTEWLEHSAAGPVTGRGQRLLLIGDQAVPFTSVTRLVFD